MNAWQPIETAPKDGEDIIVGYDCATVWIVHCAFYNDGGWWSYIENSISQHKIEPTHWLPMPKRPTFESIHGL